MRPYAPILLVCALLTLSGPASARPTPPRERADRLLHAGRAPRLGLSAVGPPRLRVAGPRWLLQLGHDNPATTFAGLGQLALISNHAGAFYGAVQLGCFNRGRHFIGLAQIGAQNHAGGFIGGVQIGAHNVQRTLFVGVAQLGLINQADREFYALVQAGAYNEARSFIGAFQLGLYNLMPQAHDQLGPSQIGLVNVVESFTSMALGQIGLLNVMAGRGQAWATVQLGLVNWTHGFLGLVQAGVLNLSEGTGALLQLALVNHDAGEVGLAQVRVVNRAGTVVGLQLGLVNVAGTLRGVQIGLVNVARRGGWSPVSPILNVSL